MRVPISEATARELRGEKPEVAPSSGLSAFLNEKPSKVRSPRRARTTMTPLEVALHDAQSRARAGQWDDAKPATFVGVYVMCFRSVYGFDPTGLDSKVTMGLAAREVTRLLVWIGDDKNISKFGSPADLLVRALRWKFLEDAKRYVAWCESHDRTVKPIGWRLAFSRDVFNEFRLNRLRRR